MAALFGLVAMVSLIVKAEEDGVTLDEAPAFVLKYVPMCIASIVLLAGTCYLVFSRWRATRWATSLEVTVEGPFLHVRENRLWATDRKVHFREIVDYATRQTALMRRCGLHELRMNTRGGLSSIIIIPGVKDAVAVRDMLIEIDRLRENH